MTFAGMIKELDLIIVNYKSTDYLRTCLGSIQAAVNGLKVNIHVFDNGSNDHVHLVKKDFTEINVIEHQRNLGYAGAINWLLKRTASPYAAILNPDTTVKDGIFESVTSFMDSNPHVGIVGPKVIDPDGCVQGSARAFPTLRSALSGRRSLITKKFPKSRLTCANILTHTSDGKSPMEVDWVSGACMVVRRKALEDVGLFDERYFLYWEDVDLCKRMTNKGWKVIYYPQFEIKHHVGGSTEHNLIRPVFEFHKSAYRYFVKNYRKHRFILRPLIIAGLSLRFIGLLCMLLVQRMTMRFNN
jgi:GT2 family glycosyltransferase